jgi:hypothetical protein
MQTPTIPGGDRRGQPGPEDDRALRLAPAGQRTRSPVADLLGAHAPAGGASGSGGPKRSPELSAAKLCLNQRRADV